MPADSGMAFVLIPHLDPTHESLMAELLAKQTAMPVQRGAGWHAGARQSRVRDPAQCGSGHRTRRAPGRATAAAARSADRDRFLPAVAGGRSAGDRRSASSCPGPAATARSALEAIKAAGGLVLAQTPESAEHDQMPRSAIATGVVDHVLTPEQMPKALLRHHVRPTAGHRAERDARGFQPDPAPAAHPDEARLSRLSHTHADAAHHAAHGAPPHRSASRGYVEFLRTHPDEVHALGKDLSIGVTAFFREPGAFQVLERVVIPELIQRSSDGDSAPPLRVWVPGCATGEEAYSIAILFLEQFAMAKKLVQSPDFRQRPRRRVPRRRPGRASTRTASPLDVPPNGLQRFFLRTADHRYQVSKSLRELITFAPQNVIRDAPFSKLHLVACRNLLIYLEPEVQDKVIALFHFALLDGGYLLLGPAESIGQAADRFEPISKKWRVYRRIGSDRRAAVEIPILPAEERRVRVPRTEHGPASRGGRRRNGCIEPCSRTFAPAAVLIDQRHEILSVQGPVVDYLEFPPGELTRDLLSLARSGLRTSIRAACQQAAAGASRGGRCARPRQAAGHLCAVYGHGASGLRCQGRGRPAPGDLPGSAGSPRLPADGGARSIAVRPRRRIARPAARIRAQGHARGPAGHD